MNNAPRFSMRAVVRLDGSAGWATERLGSASVLRCDGQTRVTTLIADGIVQREWDDPVSALRWLGETAAAADEGAGDGRWVGYISYDAGRLFESFPGDRRPPLATPLFCFARVLRGAGDMPDESGTPLRAVARAGVSKNEYLAMVRRAIEYIRAGDVFQVNLAQQFRAACIADCWSIADRLAEMTPATYGACLDFGDHAIVSNSPELFLEVDGDVNGDRTIRTRPIKGTRPLMPGMERELMNSAKDAAELNMIVDLERNDLGRICQIGSVRVEQPRTIEAHPTVYHGVATVAGTLRPEVGFVEILRAMFPGGSITGAPKIRAMEIIDELEPVQRGPYCGAIGWLGAGGAMQFNVAIRTIVMADGVATFSVGGGIVADSEAEDEYRETILKARAMLGGLNAVVG